MPQTSFFLPRSNRRLTSICPVAGKLPFTGRGVRVAPDERCTNTAQFAIACPSRPNGRLSGSEDAPSSVRETAEANRSNIILPARAWNDDRGTPSAFPARISWRRKKTKIVEETKRVSALHTEALKLVVRRAFNIIIFFGKTSE